jgi:hypothetical protein
VAVAVRYALSSMTVEMLAVKSTSPNSSVVTDASPTRSVPPRGSTRRTPGWSKTGA